jgi:tetratricopeptide (TPR) repeat protein
MPGDLSVARSLEDRGELEKAASEYRRALAADPGLAHAWRGVARVLLRQGALDEASAACGRIIALDAADGWAIGTKAWILERQGRAAQAHAFIAPAVRAHPMDVDLAVAYAKVCERLDPPCDEALPVLKAQLARAALGAEDRRVLWRAAAQLCDALGRHDEAFESLQQAKRLEPAAEARPRVARARAVAAEALAAYTGERLRRLPRATHRSELPIFIVGMPRSGTTLAEQILAAHPRIHGAGELPYIPRIAIDILPRLAPYPACLDALRPAQLNELARQYLRRLGKLAPQAARVVDKMPFNYEHLGLIELLFPRARVIHCERDALDTCVSIYFRDIPGLPENRDLAALGERYRAYRELMRRWQRLLGLRIFTLRYEALIADPEPTARALLEFCGLPWDERCLRFHESARVVKTYSYHQVRKPLYADAVGRHRAYARHLDPLRRALGAQER